MTISCLIVDDEPLAQKVLLNYVHRIDYLTVSGTCSNAPDAFRFLRENDVDLLFLDIKMPEVDGISFLKSLSHKPFVILTTAHRNYAFDGFEHGAVDFLLKPISFERFLVALDKLKEKIMAVKSIPPDALTQEANGFIFLKSGINRIKVFLKEINYIEGLKDYIVVHTGSQQVVVKSTMKQILEDMGAEKFIRVHKSYIVPIHLIQKIKGKNIRLNDISIPIGRQYWSAVKQIIT